LPLLDGTVEGLAQGINNLGQIVGTCVNFEKIEIPVIWNTLNNKPTPLQSFERRRTLATGINNLGQIVGYSLNDKKDSKVAIIWTDPNTTPTKLQLPVQQVREGLDLYAVISFSFNGIRVLPIFFPSINATPIELPLLPGKPNGFASGINILGQIVGNIASIDGEDSKPVIWANANTMPIFLQTSDSYSVLIASGISDPPAPSPAPISNICFPAGTPVQTDQGIVNIDNIDPRKHTIASQPILRITRTTTLDNYLISFDKHSLRKNVPIQKTLMTKDHKILFEGKLVPAYRFLDYSDKVKKVKYNGETLYNVLLAEYGRINVNNMVCETLHPENIIAKLYMRQVEEQPTLVFQLNSAIENKDIVSYKDVVHRLTQL
jgi:hypothetical protein